MIKPTDIVDDFGDSYLGCPNCKEPVYFPLIRNPQHIYDKRPKQCSKCGEEFDWSDDLKKGDTIQCADADDAINTMKELAKNGVQTDFLYEKDGVKGLWLQVIKGR